MKNIFKLIVAFPKAVLAISLAICLGIGVFSYKLEIDASTQTLLLENDKDLAIWREIAKRYESKNFLVIAYTPNSSLLSKQSLNKIEAIYAYEFEGIRYDVGEKFGFIQSTIEMALQRSELRDQLLSYLEKLMDREMLKKEIDML